MNKVLLVAEFLSALVAFFYYKKVKYNYWKWFSIYLIFIFIQELYGNFFHVFLSIRKQDYYAFFGIPIQYFFFYWLYAYRSQKNVKLFIFCCFIYLISFIPLEIYKDKVRTLYSLNLTTGSVLLIILIILEFLKQIKNDNILKFKENKMFYINIGVTLFYIGTYPFIAFYNELIKIQYLDIWNAYYLYLLISSSIMYLLFAASFIWGKHQS
ncbi:hypothetical protein H0I31_12125 [Tenacibaculum sp. AHE15PA]|uniref:hypothetical protein n=1 Tax=Tenacibaculum TaxID=104267 RepID=UPI001C4E4749|nr:MULTISPECIES: hypothetical protein [Tenacibaculum]QXP73722.1 hypothetical protein H0I30_00855 [Tenacibaculum sp. AHE14PA]QXP75911.1 hypothetical protein H0I31_12125 [Tenacibaculum sp. AHE15PA]